ncbi:MAG: right-handed parallel beta-helix repeat-containing protein, partial [Planctomycetota bacterium]
MTFAHLTQRTRRKPYERSRKIRALIFICTCLIFVIPSQAGTITVDDDGPADFNNIQAAIHAASNGDEIIVADGIYTGPRNQDIDFLGKAIIVRSESGPESCIIDCQNLSRAFYFHNGEDANSVLRGFTITNGYDTSGGGILCSDSSPVIADCIITGNHAGDTSGSGGGIECSRSSPKITNCTITGNSAGTGGAIHCSESTAAVTNCILSDNLAEIGSQIAITSAHPDRPCTRTLNYSDLQGGRYNVFVGNWSTFNSGTGNIDADPCFVKPGHWNHNGTPNYIWDNSWVDGDYHLL